MNLTSYISKHSKGALILNGYADEFIHEEIESQIVAAVTSQSFNSLNSVRSASATINTHPDIHVILEEGAISIEKIRELNKNLRLSSVTGVKIAIIYNAENLTLSASNALLKALEEPDGMMILQVNNMASLLPTIRSRCHKMPISQIANAQHESTDYEALLSAIDNFQIDLIKKEAKSIDEKNFLFLFKKHLVKLASMHYVNNMECFDYAFKKLEMLKNSNLDFYNTILLISGKLRRLKAS